MPVRQAKKDYSPLLIDFEYSISNKKLLAQYVGDLILGHYRYLKKILDKFSTKVPIDTNESIDQAIEKIRKATIEHRDGWLFQMISWIGLASKHEGDKNFHIHYPHFAPAQHGIDNVAVLLKNKNKIAAIVITEDKCTTSPRSLILSDVFPDFGKFEAGKLNNAIITIVSSLLENVDSGKILDSVSNNILDRDHRQYRIGITLEEKHGTEQERKKLFKKYDTWVSGASAQRRSAASVYIPKLRDWMENFADMVVEYLESKKTRTRKKKK